MAGQCMMLEFRKFRFDRALLRFGSAGSDAMARKTAMHSVWLGEFLGTLVLLLLAAA